MTDATDVLVKYEYIIGLSLADNLDSICLDYRGDIESALRDLADEVRALRERLAAQERLAGSAVTTDDVLRVWMQRMERASGQALDVKLATALACITELETENAALRERLAAQEPDATLGRLVLR